MFSKLRVEMNTVKVLTKIIVELGEAWLVAFAICVDYVSIMKESL